MILAFCGARAPAAVRSTICCARHAGALSLYTSSGTARLPRFSAVSSSASACASVDRHYSQLPPPSRADERSRKPHGFFAHARVRHLTVLCARDMIAGTHSPDGVAHEADQGSCRLLRLPAFFMSFAAGVGSGVRLCRLVRPSRSEHKPPPRSAGNSERACCASQVAPSTLVFSALGRPPGWMRSCAVAAGDDQLSLIHI